MFNTNIKLKYIIPFFLVILFSYFITKNGIIDNESYGYFLNDVFYSFQNLEFSNFLNGFDYDFTFGNSINLIQNFYYNPFNFFLIFNTKIFFFFNFILLFFIKLYFFFRILKILNIRYSLLLVTVINLIDVKIFGYYILNDNFDFFFCYTIFYGYLFYLLKTKKKIISLYKTNLFFSLFILNAHVAYIFLIIFFSLVYLIINNYSFIFKNRIFYFNLILFFIIISPKLNDFYLFVEWLINNQYQGYREPNNYTWVKDNFYNRTSIIITPIIYPFLSFMGLVDSMKEIFDFDFTIIKKIEYSFNGREFFNNPIIYFSLFKSFQLIFNKTSKKYFYLNYIFLIFFFIIFFPETFLFFEFINFDIRQNISLKLLSDILNLLSPIFFVIYLKDLKNKYFLNLSCFIIYLSCFLYFSNLFTHIDYKKNIIFNNYVKTSDNNNIFPEFPDKEFNKVLISNGVTEDILSLNHGNFFKKINLFTNKDLLKYGLYPVSFKTKNNFFDEYFITSIPYSYKNIDLLNLNNDLLFNFLGIEYFLVYEYEIKNLKLDKYFVKLDQFTVDNSFNLLLLKHNNNQLIEYLGQKKLSDCKFNDFFEQLNCLFDQITIRKNSGVKINRVKKNKYILVNKTNFEKKVVLPFFYIQKIKSKNNIKKLNNFFYIIELSPNSETGIKFENSDRKILVIVSILTFFILTSKAFVFKKSLKL